MRRDVPVGRGPAPGLFLFGAIAWTWTFIGLAALSGRPWLSFPTVLLMVVGGLGPIIVAAILVRAGFWDAGLDTSATGFVRRCLDPRTLPLRWWVGVAILVLVVILVPNLIDQRSAVAFRAGPAAFVLVGAVFGALEEPGWRGYAQEALQRQMPVAVAGVVIGVFWATWHLPLFIVAGTYQAGLGAGSPAFWAFLIALVIASPIYAWLYNAAGGVAFAAVLLHAVSNIASEYVPDTSPLASLSVAAAVAIVLLLGNPKRMGRKAQPSATTA